MKGATVSTFATATVIMVSIHAPNEGSDFVLLVDHSAGRFQSTLPMKGATSYSRSQAYEQAMFQSTLPMKGATHDTWLGRTGGEVSIHAPNEGSDYFCFQRLDQILVSIHAPNEGSDFIVNGANAQHFKFQSTLPMKGAT